MKRNFAVLFVFLCFISVASAQRRIYVNEYLNIGVGARGLSLASSQAAMANDVTAAYWNPAGLMAIKSDLEVGAMHAEYFSGNAKYDYLGIAKPLKNKDRVVAFSALRFAIDDIPNTIDYVQPDGSFDESKLKSMSAGDYAFLLSYAQKLKLFKKDTQFHTTVGGNAKVIYRHLGSMANAWGFGIDIGIQTRYKQWRFGIMAKDITTTYTSWSFHLTEREKQVFGQTGNEIPVKSYELMYPRLNFGVARTLLEPGKSIQIMAEVGVDMTTDGRRNTLLQTNAVSFDPHIGLEASYKNALFLRLGVGNFQRVLDDKDTSNTQKVFLYQPAAGVGFNIGSLSLDYAFTSLQTQANPLFTHIISLRLHLNTPDKKTKTTASPATPVKK